MVQKNTQQLVDEHEDQEGMDHAIMLPCSPEALGDFISKLLGQPQSIRKTIQGRFDIDFKWLDNAHHLLLQRISQQHSAKLIDFSAEIFFEDGLSRKLNSYEGFKSYHEPKPLNSEAIKLRWTYLINFPTKGSPEKQEISLFVSRYTPHAKRNELKFFDGNDGFIEYQIDHTERTWGDDIETILTNHIYPIIEKKRKLKALIREFSPVLAMIILMFGIVVVPAMINENLETKKINEISNEITEITNSQNFTIKDLSVKIDKSIDIQMIKQKGVKNRYVPYIVCGLTSLVISGAIVFWSIVNLPSFVVLTDAAKLSREKLLSKRRKISLISIMSFVFSIIASVVGNYFYFILTMK